MKYRLPIATFIVILMLLFTAYTPSTPLVQHIEPSKQLTPTNTIQSTVAQTSVPEPNSTRYLATDTPDPNSLIEAATLFKTDFQDGYPDCIFNGAGKWHVVEETMGSQNLVFSNDLTDQWSSFQFGKDEWENYAISLRVKFLSTFQAAEIHIRTSSLWEGYKALILNNGWAEMSYCWWGNLGRSHISIIPKKWYQVELRCVKNNLKYYIDGQLLVDVNDDRKASGRAGFCASPNTQVCVDDILVWYLDENGFPIKAPTDLIADPLDKYEGDCEFCFVDGSEPSMPVLNAPSQSSIIQPNDHREQIVIDENFTVNAGEVATFENKIVWVRPHQRQDIQVYGTLIVKDSLLLWDQTEYSQTGLRIKRGGRLTIENSYSFRINQFWVNWGFEDGSTIFFNHFVGDPWCTILYSSVNYRAINFSTVKLTLGAYNHNNTVEVSDAHHVSFELCFPPGNHTVTLPEKRKWADWKISGLWPNTDVNVVHSYIYERDINIQNDVHMTILDTPSGFGLGWGVLKDAPPSINCELRNLGDPENDKGVFYEDMTWDLPLCNSSLTVKNSLLQITWPFIEGYVNLKIYNSNLADIGVNGSTATMEIYDSIIALFFAGAGGKGYIENSKIRGCIQTNDPNSVVYLYRVSSKDPNNPFKILGSGTCVQLDSPGPPW